MSILSEMTSLLGSMHYIVETGVFKEEAPDTYTVITPLSDVFDLHADNKPGIDVQEARISIYTKANYVSMKNSIVRGLLKNGFTITDRRYLGFETETGYHHYAVDAAKYYQYDMEDN